MGSAHTSHTNLGGDCTSLDAGATGTKARWGDSFHLSMGTWKENNDHTHVWGAKYKTSSHDNNENHSCGFQLKATYDNNNGVESIYFGLGDSSPNNETKFSLEVTRVARDGLSGGIIGVKSSSGAAPLSFTRVKEGCTIETTIVSYGCSQRDGLLVLEMKKKVNSQNAYMVSLAHYYVAKDVGLSVAARIFRCKSGQGFGVEVEGPFKHPGADLRKVIVKTCGSGVWSPNACSHCRGAKASTGVKAAVNSNDSLAKAQDSIHHHHDHGEEVVKHATIFSSNVREQYNKGLINSSGYTSGSLNNSIIFMNCNF